MVTCVCAILFLSTLPAIPFTQAESRNTWGLQVKGNQILSAIGTPIILKGMTYSYFAFNENGSWMLPSGEAKVNEWDTAGVDNTLIFLEASNSNALRLMLSAQLWINNFSEYHNHIKYVITKAANRGIYTDVTFYNSLPTESQVVNVNPWEYGKNNPLKSSADFVNLWGNVSSVLKDFPSVIFELWNEPNGNEAEWFRVSQLCINRIREVGATQPINVMYNLGVAYDWGNGGVNWINTQNPPLDMSWANDNHLKDSANNLLYSTHLYRFSFVNSSITGSTQSGYKEIYSYSDMLYALNVTGVLSFAATRPLTIFEIGHNNWASDPSQESEWYNSTLTILDKYGIGYCGFAIPPLNRAMERWGLVLTNELQDQYWIGNGIANYTLSTAGTILVFHLGGIPYSDWINSPHSRNPIPTTTQIPDSDQTTDSISNTVITISIIITASTVAAALTIWKIKKTKSQKRKKS
jgi:hypothetical protein